MKIWLSILSVAAGLLAQQGAPVQNAAPVQQQKPTKPEDLCGLEGQVTNAATGAPVRKAELVLQRVDLGPKTGALPVSYSTTSGAGGKFAMKNIEPGKYRLSVSRNGFVRASYGSRGPDRPGTTLSLDPGQRLKEVNFKLTPHGVITGRIVDEDGDPVAHAMVRVESYRRLEGRKELYPANGASTNDLGEYRVFGLAPGRYYLNATYLEMGFEAAARDGSAAPRDEGYVPTYYPGGIDVASAAMVEVTPGAEVRGMNITLSKTHTVRLRGHVTHPGGRGRQNIMLTLTPRGQAGWWFGGLGRNQTDAQGNFELRGVRPGAYWLMAMTFEDGHTLSVRQEVDVGNNNVDNLVVTLSPGMELPGEIKLEGRQGVSLADIHVSLRPHETGGLMFGPQPNDKVKDDGTFKLGQVAQEQYDIHVGGLPDGYYVKSIRAGDEEVRDAGLDMTRGAAGPLTVTISPGAGQVEGAVLNHKQETAAGALVVLIPDDSARRERRESYQTATTDQYGRFVLKGIIPGEYKVYAWDDIESGAYMDPDFMKPFESRGEAVSIHEDGRESVQLKLIPAETSP